MSTRDVIKELIQRLYNESLKNGLNFQLSRFDNSGRNYLVAEDGTFLGNLSNQLDPKSIFNSFSPYGSKYSLTSIFNAFSQYGSSFSQLSPTNKFTQTPPKIYINGAYFGRLTTNRFVVGSKPTDVFLFYVLDQLGLLDLKLDDLIEIISRM